MAAVNLLWHLHQPDYRQPDTGQALMPWVRLHAAKGYSDLALALGSSPSAHCAVNFSGILLDQLAHLAAGNLDYYAELSLKEPEELEPTEREFILRNFFSANTANMINTHPRYRELARRRQSLIERMDLADAAREFEPDDLRDLCTWFNLAWIGFAHARRREISRLIAQGRGFERADVQLVIDTQVEIAQGVVGQYKELAEAGVIELSITPQHHPILPLLLDLAGMAAPDPDHPLPHFGCQQCAQWQVATALETFRKTFDKAPAGAWPAEGSVSDATLALLGEHGIRWAATDQQNLPPGWGHLGHIQPYRWQHQGQELTVFFRDTRLSDNIGFEYSRWTAEAAARHFTEMCCELARNSGFKQSVVTVALDGENPWEYFRDGGSRFLSCLFSEIARNPQLECRLPRDLAAEPGLHAIRHISPGSWIGGNFDVWSRHPETRRAWQLLAAAHNGLAHAGNAAIDSQLLAAEASDYFWWYGDDFSSNEKPLFDLLFRAHLIQAYELAGRDAPEELLAPLGQVGLGFAPPVLPAIQPPVLDGRRTTYFEWQGALKFSGLDSGAMARQTGSGVRGVRLGVAEDALFMRIDLDEETVGRIRVSGAELRITCSQNGGGRDVALQIAPGRLPLLGADYAVGRDCEVRISLAEAGLSAGQLATLKLVLACAGAPDVVFPGNGGIRFRLPAAGATLDWWWV